MAQSAREPMATVTLRLAAPLVELFPGAPRKVTVDGATVSDAIDALNAAWPGMRDRICDSTPAIRRHMNIFIDGERARLETPLRPGDELFILTAISGG